MTEQTAPPHRSNSRKSILYELLVIFIVLIAVIVVYLLIFSQGLIPGFSLSATSTQTATPTDEIILPEAPSKGYSSLVRTLTALPSTETPSTETPSSEAPMSTGTPTAEAPAMPSPTPAFGSCQYTLKSGPGDFLYTIYWNWRIYKRIPVVKDFYAKIYCASLLSNLQCEYQAADPGTIQPGWILILPGVTSNNCLNHGGKPLP
jgi:hypothetical protein